MPMIFTQVINRDSRSDRVNKMKNAEHVFSPYFEAPRCGFISQAYIDPTWCDHRRRRRRRHCLGNTLVGNYLAIVFASHVHCTWNSPSARHCRPYDPPSGRPLVPKQACLFYFPVSWFCLEAYVLPQGRSAFSTPAVKSTRGGLDFCGFYENTERDISRRISREERNSHTS